MPQQTLPSEFGRFTLVLKDHQHLIVTLQRLRHLCAALEARPGPEPLKELALLLADLHSELGWHFAREESDNYFGAVALERPALIPRIAELRAEHAAFLQTIEEIAQRSSDDGECLELARRTLSLTEQLASHERREAALMHEFFHSDA